MKIQQPERAPSVGSSHQEKRIAILWAGPAKRKERFALLIEERRQRRREEVREKGRMRREYWLGQGTVKADRRERNWPTEEDREAGSL